MVFELKIKKLGLKYLEGRLERFLSVGLVLVSLGDESRQLLLMIYMAFDSKNLAEKLENH